MPQSAVIQGIIGYILYFYLYRELQKKCNLKSGYNFLKH